MPTLQELVETLDRMIDGPTSKPELRSQIAFIGREIAVLEAKYAELHEAHTQLKQAQTARDQEMALENRHKVGVTLNNGITRYYDADSYDVLPNFASPKMVEIRKTDKERRSFRSVAIVSWSEIAEIHKPAALA